MRSSRGRARRRSRLLGAARAVAASGSPWRPPARAADLFRSGTALTMMSLMGIAIVFALSYNMLLGQTGMLSFGHAVYYGLGAYLGCTPSTLHRGKSCRSRCRWCRLSGSAQVSFSASLRLGLDQAQRHRIRDDLARVSPSWSARAR